MVTTLSYLVPDGIDASVLSSALARAGYSSALEIVGGDERLLIRCQLDDRERIRTVLEGVEHHAYDASGLRIGAVTFRDEP